MSITILWLHSLVAHVISWFLAVIQWDGLQSDATSVVSIVHMTVGRLTSILGVDFLSSDIIHDTKL